MDPRIIPLQEGEFDGGPSRSDHIGALTRTMVKRLEEGERPQKVFLL